VEPYTDAKFKVIRRPRRRWRIVIDWRNFLLIAAVALLAFLQALPSLLAEGR